MAMDATYYQSIYSRALAASGSAEYANEAVQVAQAALKDIYNKAMVKTGGDNVRSAALERQMSEPVSRLAQLIPQIRNPDGDVNERGAALRQLQGVLEELGYDGGRQGLHGWLRANVQDDGVLRAAGYDPVAVKTIPKPEGWPDDLEALITLLRDRLQLIQSMRPDMISDAEIDAQLDVVRASAHRFGYQTPTVAPTVEETNGPAPEGTVSVADLAPRRI